MSLDIFTQDRNEALDYAAQTSAAHLPATFADTFGADWNLGQMFGQSIAQSNARAAVLSDITEDLYRRTGDQQFLTAGLTQEGLPDPTFHVGLLNDRIAKYRQANPSFEYPDLSEDDVQARMVQKSRAARSTAAEMAGRERTWGGTFGSIAGSLASSLTDPLNTVAMPLAAPEALGVLGTALAWGAIAGGTQGANELVAGPYRERVQPGYGQSGEPAANILQAGVGGAVLGGGMKGAAALWERFKPLSWARSVRDAGNVIESEAQIAATNPLPGAAGEVAHRDALSSAIDSVTEGKPVDVDHIITPEQADAIAAHEDTATADYWEQRLAEASPEERATLGATDTPGVSLPDQTVKAMREDAELSGALDHDFEHLRAEHGDKLIPMGETVDAAGERVPLMRSVNDILAEADRRESVANELLACLMPEAA